MIVAQNLTKRFGRIVAVDGVDFDIPRGHVVGFLGPNGAGKSTAIRMITGFLPPTAGRAIVGGHDVVRHWRLARSLIGYLPESAPLYTEMRVRDYLAFRGRLFGLRGKARRSAIDRVIGHCKLAEVRRRPIGQLSKGFRQRVGLAAALLHDPPVLILDEPTVGLDPAQIREVRSLIRDLAGSHTILLSTHILPEVELTCDRVVLIARGRIRGQGTIKELQQRAAGATQYVVETDAPRAEAVLAALPMVQRVEARRLDSRWCRVTVTPRADDIDLREQISRALADVQSITRELHRLTPSLEHLFVKMVADAETADGPAGTGNGAIPAPAPAPGPGPAPGLGPAPGPGPKPAGAGTEADEREEATP